MPQIRFSPIQNNDGTIHLEDTLTNWSRGLEYMFGHIAEDNIISIARLADYAKYVAQPVHNVKGYGAKGDGVTDDTAAIQAAVDAAEAAGGGIVFFPNGTYLTSSTLTVESSNVHLVGAGKSSTLINYTGSAVAVQVGDGIINAQNVQISNLYINDSGTGTIGIYTTTAKPGLNIQHVRVQGFSTAGIQMGDGSDYVTTAGSCYDIQVQDCAIGFWLRKVNVFTLYECEVVNATGKGFQFDDCFSVEMQGCHAETLTAGAIVANSCYAFSLSHFYAENVGGGAVSAIVLNNCVVPSVRCIYLNGSSSTGIGIELQGQTRNGVFDTISALNFITGAFKGVATSNDNDVTNIYINAGTVFVNTSGLRTVPSMFRGEASGVVTHFSAQAAGATHIGRFGTGGAKFYAGTSSILGQYGSDGYLKFLRFESLEDIYQFTGGQIIKTGTGSPGGAVAAPVGSLFLRTDGGAGTVLYVKESGTGNTGWVAK